MRFYLLFTVQILLRRVQLSQRAVRGAEVPGRGVNRSAAVGKAGRCSLRRPGFKPCQSSLASATQACYIYIYIYIVKSF